MKPPRFKYAAPERLEDVLELLAEYGDEAKVLAGGQSLVPLMNLRLAKPAVLIDINRVAGLSEIARTPDGGVVIGAMVRQAQAYVAPDLVADYPVIPYALRFVGHHGTRTRGTLGGSAAHSDPAAEVPTLLLTLDARLEAKGPNGRRMIPAEDFFLSTFETDLEEDEVLTAIHLGAAPTVRKWAYQQMARRHGDFALVGVAMTADVDGDGTCQAARIGIAGVSDVPVLASEAMESLVGTRLTAADGEAAGKTAAGAIDPPGDVHASSEYRRRLVSVLVSRAVAALSDGEG